MSDEHDPRGLKRRRVSMVLAIPLALFGLAVVPMATSAAVTEGFSIANGAFKEGNVNLNPDPGSLVKVTRTGPTTSSASVTATFYSGSARFTGDVVAGSEAAPAATQVLSFAVGQTVANATFHIRGESTYEPTERFYVILSNPVGAGIVDGFASVDITNDDTAPNDGFEVGSVFTAESSVVSVPVFRAGDRTAAASVAVYTENDSAVENYDFVPIPAASPMVVNFAAGESMKTVAVTIKSDVIAEADETFVVKLKSPVGGTIRVASAKQTIVSNQRPTPVVGLQVDDASYVESGNTLFFTVTRYGPNATAATVQWKTDNGTAIAGTDYVAVPLTPVTFAAGERTKDLAVTLIHDNAVEPIETFTVTLSSPSGVTITDGSAVMRIANDD